MFGKGAVLAACFCLLALLFYSEDETSKFLRNIGELLQTALHHIQNYNILQTKVELLNNLLYFNILRYSKSRDSSVGIATGYGLDDRGVGILSPGRGKNFLFSTLSRLALGPTQSPIQWVPGIISPGVKRLGRESVYPPPHTPSWSSTSLAEHRDNFTFTAHFQFTVPYE
jgi:hypothetical protein